MICKMISLDTSTTASGWAYWENATLTEYGELLHNAKKEKDIELRLNAMSRDLIELLEKYQPDIIVIELTAAPKGAQTQRSLTELIGVVRGWAAFHDTDFVRVRPSHWRKLAKQYCEREFHGEITLPTERSQLKCWSMDVVKKQYGIQVDDNISDAILIGISRIEEINQYLKKESLKMR